jgi:hypothetical protein
MKKIIKSASLLVLSSMIITQLGCSTPSANTNGTTNNTTNTEAKATMQTLLLTQKDDKGLSSPILPEDIESININGKVYSSSDINLGKGEAGFSIKAEGAIKLSYKNGRFVLEGVSGDSVLNISFKLKGSSNSIILPNSTLAKLTGDIRVEVTKDSSGNITGFSGGINKDGQLDTTKPVFQYDSVNKKLIILSSSGSKITYDLDDVKTEVKVETKVEEKISEPEKEIKKVSENISKPSPVTPFVGAWKSSILTAKVKLVLRPSGSSNIGYTASIDSSLPSFKGSFSGSASFTETSNVNKLDIASTMNGKSIKGNISLTGDNSLTLNITETDVAEIKTYLNLPVTLERGE